jgi:hypothetical protein
MVIYLILPISLFETKRKRSLSMKFFIYSFLILLGTAAHAKAGCDDNLSRWYRFPCESAIEAILIERGCAGTSGGAQILSTGSIWTREINAEDYEMIAHTLCNGKIKIFRLTARHYSSGRCTLVDETSW